MHPQATVARGGSEDELRRSTQTLTCAIADYSKRPSRLRGFEIQNKPKGKAAVKKPTAATPSVSS